MEYNEATITPEQKWQRVVDNTVREFVAPVTNDDLLIVKGPEDMGFAVLLKEDHFPLFVFTEVKPEQQIPVDGWMVLVSPGRAMAALERNGDNYTLSFGDSEDADPAVPINVEGEGIERFYNAIEKVVAYIVTEGERREQAGETADSHDRDDGGMTAEQMRDVQDQAMAKLRTGDVEGAVDIVTEALGLRS